MKKYLGMLTFKGAKKGLRPLQKLSLYFFNRPKTTAVIWLVIAVFGAASYATLLKREGFPAVQTPFAVANGTYFVNDPAKVDQQIAAPISDYFLSQDGVKAVQTQSQDNFYSVSVSYESNINAESRTTELRNALAEKKLLPAQATIDFKPFKFGFTERGDDLVVSFFALNGTSQEELVNKASEAAEFFQSKNLALVKDVSVINPFQKAVNPLTGQAQVTQQSFDRYGERADGKNRFYDSVVVGFVAQDGADKLELNEQVQAAVDELNNSEQFSKYKAVISASDAPQINEQISELQRVLLEGLIAILVVGSLVIAIRASLLTSITIITVLATVNGLLYFIGYSLNTITLFALILALALIIDDTIIMVEALDAQRRRNKKPADAVAQATGKVSRAMIAATTTAALSFAPLIFVGGVLGEFIRAIPITIMAALFISLLVALIFTPLFARFILLRKNQMGSKSSSSISTTIEGKIAEFLARPMLWARNSTRKLAAVGLSAILISFLFIGAGGYLFQKVTFNIFPSSKDANDLQITLNFPAGTSIQQAQKTTDQAEEVITSRLGKNFVVASYYGQANAKSAIMSLRLTDYKDRDIKAPQIVDELEKDFEKFNGAQVNVVQLDAGPPTSVFAVRIDSSANREGALKLAGDIENFLSRTELKRLDGSKAKIKSTATGNADVYTRDENKQYIEVTAEFEDSDTTTLVTLAQSAVEEEFTKEKVASYGLGENAVTFNFGQEDENQESFATLALAFPAVLVAIYALLAIQFRSLVQPLLIFMAIPFSLFGITLGLYLTDNAFSFFAMLGFFALIGLSIKNTILLTDFANQSRRAGSSAIDAAHEALAERFRPLVATSLTAVVSLIPLALTSPFWEGLTVVLIFGLLSSTLLVLTVFPYYYLGSEFLRSRFSRKTVISWLVLSVVAISLFVMLELAVAAVLSPLAVALAIYVFHRHKL